MRKTRKNRESTKNIFVTIQDYILCLIGNLINNKTLKLRCNHYKTANRTYNNNNLQIAIQRSLANKKSLNNKNLLESIQRSRKNQVLQTLKNVHKYPGGVEETKE
jgi:hypothetical protein